MDMWAGRVFFRCVRVRARVYRGNPVISIKQDYSMFISQRVSPAHNLSSSAVGWAEIQNTIHILIYAPPHTHTHPSDCLLWMATPSPQKHGKYTEKHIFDAIMNKYHVLCLVGPCCQLNIQQQLPSICLLCRLKYIKGGFPSPNIKICWKTPLPPYL